MSKSPLARGVALAALGTSLTLPTISQAAFIEDSKASVELRNFYMNRDFRQEGAAQSKAEEWAQGFLLRYESGYTEGTVGFGVDAIGTLGLKLDSGGGTSGTGLLQRDRESGEAQDSYGDLGVTAKVKVSNSVLKVGTLMPKLPVVQANDSRLLPQSFQGGWINSQEFAGLTFDAGQLSRVNQRDSSDHETMVMTTGTGRGFTGPREKFWLSKRMVDNDPEGTRSQLEKVHRLLQEQPQLRVIPAHDEAVQRQLGYYPKWVE